MEFYNLICGDFLAGIIFGFRYLNFLITDFSNLSTAFGVKEQY
jgi:hypothetical protein